MIKIKNEMRLWIATGIICFLLVIGGFVSLQYLPVPWKHMVPALMAAYLLVSFIGFPGKKVRVAKDEGGGDIFEEMGGHSTMIYPTDIASVFSLLGYCFEIPQRRIGWMPLLWGIFWLRKTPGVIIQKQFPGEPEEIFQGPEKTVIDGKEVATQLPPGMVWPMRVTHKAEPEKKGKDSLAARQTTQWSAFVKFRVTRKRHLKFLQQFYSLGNIIRQLRDDFEALCKQYGGQHTVSDCIDDWRAIQTFLDEKIQERWGKGAPTVPITVAGSGVARIEMSHAINQAIADAVAAIYDKDALITRSEGARQQEMNIGKGKAVARQLFLLAEKVGFEATLKAFAKVMETEEGKAAGYLWGLREFATSPNEKVIIPGSENIYGLLTGLQKALGNVQKGGES